jgi:hypothetical protein
MQIEISSVSTQFTKTAKGGYSTAMVQYVNDRGETKSWKLMSFSNPKVFDTLKNATAGQVYEITTGKNDRDFTVWAQADLVDGVAASSSPARANKTPVVSQYETRDERNLRQRLIVRQSCLAQAVAYYTGTEGGGGLDEILKYADEFVAWVFEAPSLMEEDEATS